MLHPEKDALDVLSDLEQLKVYSINVLDKWVSYRNTQASALTTTPNKEHASFQCIANLVEVWTSKFSLTNGANDSSCLHRNSLSLPLDGDLVHLENV